MMTVMIPYSCGGLHLQLVAGRRRRQKEKLKGGEASFFKDETYTVRLLDIFISFFVIVTCATAMMRGNETVIYGEIFLSLRMYIQTPETVRHKILHSKFLKL